MYIYNIYLRGNTYWNSSASGSKCYLFIILGACARWVLKSHAM